MIFQIKRVRPTKYRTPKWWETVEGLNPDIRLNFLNEYILNSSYLVDFLINIPNQCPFNRAYEAVFPNGDSYLICYIPRLCKINPIFNWIVDLKLEAYYKKEVEKDLEKLEEIIPEDEELDIPSVQSILTDNLMTNNFVEK